MAGSQGKNTTGGGSRKGWKIGAGVLGAVFGLGVLAYGVDVVLSQGKVPRGVTVGGVEIGGMERAAAVATLERELGAAESQPVTVRAAGEKASFVPEAAGMEIDYERTVSAAGRSSANPITRVTSFFTTHEMAPEMKIDEALFAPEVARMAKELAPEPVEGGVVIEEGKPLAKPEPKVGQRVDAAELRDTVLHDWLRTEGVNVKAEMDPPKIGEEEVARVLAGDAARAVAGPLVAHGKNEVTGEIPVARMGEVLSFQEKNGSLVPHANVGLAIEILDEQLKSTESVKKNATIKRVGGEKVIGEHTNGVSINWEKTLDRLEQKLVSPERDIEVVYQEDEASFTTEMAEQATFDDVISEFTTSGFSGPSGVNIQKVAEIVDGAILAPDDTFSLNEYTGPRGKAQGFVESGIILDGKADTAVGGGISQFATTLYNAAYFAGMEDVAHTPHSFYISRYPAGREATVFEGAIDLQFKNTSEYPVLIETVYTPSSITVRMLGVKTVEVESVSGGRRNYTDPKPRTVTDANCLPSSGSRGFTTSDTRIIRDLNGKELSRETTTTVYNPEPIIRCSRAGGEG